LVGKEEFKNGNISAALNKNKDAYVEGNFNHVFPLPETDLTRYRDYLREIWLNWIVKVECIEGLHFDRDRAIRQLNARFHQNFLTTDFKERPANGLIKDNI
jgi:hypothetical protein